MKILNRVIIIASILFLVVTPCVNSIHQPKARIISLTPASTEILFALGLDKEIIGVSSFCNWPKEAQLKEKVGSFSSPNIEKIIILKPDLVVITGLEQEFLKNILSKLGIEHYVVDPADIIGLIKNIEELGDITDRRHQAQSIINGIRDTINEIGRKTAKKSKPKVYVEIWHDPIMTIGDASFVSDMVKNAGGINVTGDLKRPFSKIDPEEVIFKNPDLVLLTYMKPDAWVRERFKKRLGWDSVAAVKDDRIYTDINADIILRPGPRIREGLIELYKRFYED
jgi:iron complex transport system substrate-binding protein